MFSIFSQIDTKETFDKILPNHYFLSNQQNFSKKTKNKIKNNAWVTVGQVVYFIISRNHNYRQVSNIRRTWVGNEIIDHWYSWSIACRRCSNYIFILHWPLGFNILCEDNGKPSRETFKFWDLVRLVLEIWLYMYLKRSKKTIWADK